MTDGDWGAPSKADIRSGSLIQRHWQPRVSMRRRRLASVLSQLFVLRCQHVDAPL